MQVLIGTSGWIYRNWTGRFYPKELKDIDKLAFYSREFSTVEINSTFYHMPLAKSVQRWYDVAPAEFKYAVKLNRFMTHTKRLLPDESFDDTLQEFYARISLLKEKLGVVLVQLPPGLKVELERLKHLVVMTTNLEKEFGLKFPLAIEFRHKTWFESEVFDYLRTNNIANVIIDSPGRWPANREVTGDIAYIRFHGSTRLYRSSYSNEELQSWAEFIKSNCGGCKQVYAYFNNDYNAVAINNARTLLEKIDEV